MINMNKEFTTYNQALALKELGFDEPCIGWYNPQVNYKKVTTDRYWAFHLTGEWENFKPAPLYQQAFRWFREKYNHVGFIQLVEPEYGGEYGYVIYYNPNHLSVHHWNKGFKTYEEAEQACLDKLIEIVKNNAHI